MKNTILSLITLLLFTTLAQSQNLAVNKTFNKYALKDGFVTVDISGKMINMFLDEDEKIEDERLGSIKILSVEDSSLNDGLNFYNEIIPKLNMENYNKWLHISTEDEQVVFMHKKKGKGKPEFLMVVGGNDNALIYVEGSFNFNEASKITDIINSKEFKKKAGSK